MSVASDTEERLNAGYRYALSLTGHAADAEDLVHESWSRLLARYGQDIDRALLFRAIRNLYVDGFRHRRRFPTQSLDADVAGVHRDAIAIEEPPDKPLHQALSRLADAERETLFLAVVEGWTASEIAEATDRPRSSVLSTLHRTRRKLRGWLEGTPSPDTVATPELTLVTSNRRSRS